MILTFTLLILFVSMLALMPIMLDPDLRQNLKFWSIVAAALSLPWILFEAIK
jgi:hypothetical protein